MDIHMIDEIWCFRKYDMFGFRVAPGETVVDIGAHIGAFSVYAATVCGAGRIIALEPHPDNFRMLLQNVRANGMSCTTCVNEAVAGQAGKARLELNPRNSGGHRLRRAPPGRSIEVVCCTLSDICRRFAINDIGFLKLDCEGAEYEILLRAAPDVLARTRRLSMEYHEVEEHGVGELVEALSSYGFVVRLYDGHRLYACRAHELW